MGKTSRDKGKRGERELAAEFRRYGVDAHRGQQYHGGGDSPDVVGITGIHVECKRVEKFALWDALVQATEDAATTGGGMPAVFHRKNGKPWVVIMEFSNWMRLYLLSGMQWPQMDDRKTYGELFTENCRLRDENSALRNELETLKGEENEQKR